MYTIQIFKLSRIKRALIEYLQVVVNLCNFPFDEDKWINYIINLESKLKDFFKVLKKKEKITEKEFDNICSVATSPDILYSNLKAHITGINNTPKF